MVKKIFFSDLDGTLLKKNHKISFFTKQIMKKLIKQNDYLFIISTGRILENAIKISKKLGCHKQSDGYVISDNGAQIYSFKENRIIYNKFLSHSDIISIDNLLFNNKNIDVHYYSKDSVFVYKETYESKYWSKLMRANYIIMQNHEAFLKEKNICISRILIIFRNNNLKEQEDVIKLLKTKLTTLNLNKQNDCVYEITQKNVNKGTALRFVSKRLNIKIDDTISFGDSYTDYSLIKNSGTGLVVKNGIPELKKIADEIIEGNQNNGPALYIWKKYIRKEYN